MGSSASTAAGQNYEPSNTINKMYTSIKKLPSNLLVRFLHYGGPYYQKKVNKTVSSQANRLMTIAQILDRGPFLQKKVQRRHRICHQFHLNLVEVCM